MSPAVSPRRRWQLMTGALVLVATGALLSHRVEPGVRVERVTVAGDIPALRFVPEGSGPHPVALLAHGVTASKETLFRFGEALAAAGFTSLAIDFPGHGESHRPFRPAAVRDTLPRAAAEVGPVDVFLGHSMGAYVGSAALGADRFRPRLVIAVGALPQGPPAGTPLLVLCGRFEEALPSVRDGLPPRLRDAGTTRLVISPWSDHALEPYDPVLVRAAVEAACAAVGRPAPRPPTRWMVRLLGLAVGLAGSLALSLLVPVLPARGAWARGPLVAGIHVVTVWLTATPWVGAEPVAKRVPVQLAAGLLAWLALHVAGRLNVPRWAPAAAFAALALVVGLLGAPFPALFATLAALLLGVGAMLGAIAARGGSRRDGDVAMAIVVGWAFGQWCPLLA